MPTIAQRSGNAVARAALLHTVPRVGAVGNTGAVDVPIAFMFVGVIAWTIHAARRGPMDAVRVVHGVVNVGSAADGGQRNASSLFPR
jgi:hypothetical protein